MSEHYLAQCPHCSATFKVQDQHLQAAGGKVRCGSCMQVFNALEQLEEKGLINQPKESVIERAAQSQESLASKNKINEAAQNALIDEELEDFVFEDNPEEDASDGGYAGTSRMEDEFDTAFIEAELKKDHEFNDVIQDGDSLLEAANKDDGSDESWAEKMLDEDVDSSSDKGKPKSPSPEIPSGLKLETMHDEPVSPPAPAPVRPDVVQKTPPLEASEQETLADFNPENDFDAIDNSPYQSLKVEPIATKKKSQGFPILKKVFWTLLVIVLTLGALGQLAYSQFDRLVQNPSLRPFYAIACNLGGCKLPDLVDISKIKSQNLVVRSHPAVKNSLIIDAVIINKASFEQPFPRLGLHFSDINNNIVAERIFAPDEYLSGDAKEMTLMPAETPVRLVIEIQDPGTQAVNYSISFRKAAKE